MYEDVSSLGEEEQAPQEPTTCGGKTLKFLKTNLLLLLLILSLFLGVGVGALVSHLAPEFGEVRV